MFVELFILRMSVPNYNHILFYFQNAPCIKNQPVSLTKNFEEKNQGGLFQKTF